MSDIVCLTTNVRAICGESPVWSNAEKVVYWVDITGRKIYRTDPIAKTTDWWETPSFVGMIALRKKGGLVAGLVDGIYGFEPNNGRFEHLVDLERDIPENRVNDSKCDAAGRLWVATMNNENWEDPSGKLYCIEPDLSITTVQTGIRIPNGLAWSPDSTRMYHTDTRTGDILIYDYDLTVGERGSGEILLSYDRENRGGVDGAAMDVDGGYWTVLYGGSTLIRITPDGEIDQQISLPVSQPTMPAFGGADMKTIFITSATQHMDENAIETESFAGELIMLETEFEGSPEGAFGG